ncbi:ABC transporter permease [Flavitalea sp. BT771]|uniref:ABC transporter permease n=1 Tax=Flavitalea sp. BT771 TaxID=3063329 RepID=UPI0026E1D7BF|nr:ABC transporter permease [Flavitalea sp. BT771]MDO6430893.1 ABC transporter permease [Flavitalea sp. BT771]MDV6218967.1 ABC transporter permease [Flavitalea sp. BT771]
MFGTYLKTAWRNILRGRFYSLLNLLGLATGMAVALVIGLWVTDQLEYDHFIPGYEQAYQVRFRYNDHGVIRSGGEVCMPLADALKRDIPEVAHTAPIYQLDKETLVVGDKRIGGDMDAVGEEFLQVFPFPLVEGDAATALKEPGTVVISESMAKATFGNVPALGKTVRLLNWGPRKVTAVLQDFPRSSSFHFQILLPWADFKRWDWVPRTSAQWNLAIWQMYVSLKPGADAAKAEARAAGLVKHYSPDSYAMFQREPVFFAMKDWHLYTEFKEGRPWGGLIDSVRMFSIVGILVLVIACINFMNLSTARSEKRAREVGVRKVMGSSRRGLIFQFLIESLVMTTLAFLLALLITEAVLPAFRAMTGEEIHIPRGSTGFWLLMMGYVVVTGLLAGARPAFYLSSFQPVKVLKGTMRIGRAAAWPRKVLVVLQFTCSIALIIGTIIVYQQIQYAKERPSGYDPNRLLVTGLIGENHRAVKQDMLNSGAVTSMTKSLSSTTEVYGHETIDQWPGWQPGEAILPVIRPIADQDYFRTLGMQFVAGSNFTGNFGADTTCVIFNEAAVKRMRLEQPINQYVHWQTVTAPSRLRIIGVVKDALSNNPFAEAEPAMYLFQPGWSGRLLIRLEPTMSTSVALAKIKGVHDQYDKEHPFEYRFVDQDYASTFAVEEMIGKLAGVFAGLAIFISCLGLFGLAAYMAEQRTKEIGIRKVLGASVGQMVVLLSGDFLLLVGVSCVIASPVAYYFLHHWLAGYYYKITINPVVFVVAAVLALVITAITVGFQSVRSAMKNPVTALRSE